MPTESDPLWNAILRLRQEVERSYRVRVGLEARTRSKAIGQLQQRVQRESFLRGSIDEACRHWILRRAWPMMDSETAIHVCDRFEHSVDLAAWLHQNGFRAVGRTENQLLEFFLVENWVGYGCHRMRARLATFLLGN